MVIFLRKALADVAFLIMRVLDAIVNMFRVLCGLNTVNIADSGESEGQDLLSFFMDGNDIASIWIYIMLISLALLALFTIIAIIKAMASPKKTQSKVMQEFFGAILAFFIAQIVVFGGIAVSNEVLSFVDDATQNNSQLTLSQKIMDIAVADEGWQGNYSASDFDPSMSAQKVFGQYKEHPITGMEQAPDYAEELIKEDGTSEWRVDDDVLRVQGLADLYKTNLFLLVVIPLILIVLLGIAVIKLSQRIFKIVFLYIVMPFTVSSIPLDDGSRFKLWREQMLATVLSVYGTVIAFNLFTFFIGTFERITIGTNEFVNTIFRVVLIIGAAFFAGAGADTFAAMLGGQPQQHGNLGQMIYSGMQGMALGSALTRGAKSLLFGGKGGGHGGGGSGGGSSGGGGGLGGVLGALGKVGNAAATVMGGNKYTGFKANASTSYQNLKNTLAGKPLVEGSKAGKYVTKAKDFMDAGGIAGATKGFSEMASGKGQIFPEGFGSPLKKGGNGSKK